MKFSDKIFKKKNVLIVDAMNIAFRWKHQGKEDFKEDYLRTVQSLAMSYECSKIIIAADQGSSAFRKEIDPEYKGNRKEKYKDQTEKEKEAMVKFFEDYEKSLELMAEKYLVLRRQSVEADDLAAYIVKHKKKFNIEDIWLISSDRDWDLLISDEVSRFSTVTRKETTVFNWDEFFDFPQEDYISYKVLTGDKGDNIPGISGIGPKRASDLINQYGSAFDIHDSLPLEGSYKHIKTLNESGDLLLKNYAMMDLLTYCDEAVAHPGHSLEEVDKEISEYIND
jgi:5'-3' exonuclease